LFWNLVEVIWGDISRDMTTLYLLGMMRKETAYSRTSFPNTLNGL
jgi:hypothetical protein